MNVLQVVSRLCPGSGVTDAAVRLASGLNQLGVSVELATVDGPTAENVARCEAEGVRITLFRPFRPAIACYSADMHARLGALVRRADVVHVHGAWTFPVWWGCRVALAGGVPLVRSPHGSFQPAALDKSALRKRIVGALLERPFLRQAAVVHATAEHEAAAVRAYGARGLVVVVPNAIDPVELDPCAEAPRERIDARCPACRGRRYALVLSRLHPMKGIDLLLASWRRVVSEFPTWHLLIAGPRDGRFERALVRQAAMLQLQGSLTFCGPLFGIDKEAALSHASVLVLPSRSENFGMSVAEALAHGVPVIATRGSPWSGVTGVRGPSVTESFPDGIADGPCGWCVEASVDGLAHALRDALQLDDAARAAMGARGRHWVGRALDSRPLAARMLQAYEACLRHPR